MPDIPSRSLTVLADGVLLTGFRRAMMPYALEFRWSGRNSVLSLRNKNPDSGAARAG